MKVFLGGTTSGWKWRNKFQKMLECNYYNPITHGWSEKDRQKEVYERDIIENIKKVWTEEMGKKESELVDLKIYIKPEDNGAHYVINGDITGFIEL